MKPFRIASQAEHLEGVPTQGGERLTTNLPKSLLQFRVLEQVDDHRGDYQDGQNEKENQTCEALAQHCAMKEEQVDGEPGKDHRHDPAGKVGV